MRSAPQRRLFVTISLINVTVSSESFGFLARALDVCFQNTRKSSRGPREPRLRLNQERLFPGSNHLGQEYQQKPVFLLRHRAFDLSMQDEQVVARVSRFLPAVRLCLGSDRRTFRVQGRSSEV